MRYATSVAHAKLTHSLRRNEMLSEQPDGDRCGECAAEIHRLEAVNKRLLEALHLSVHAMRAPIDDWKGVVERSALDAANTALKPN